MDPKHRRQPQIIRSMAGVALAALAVMPARAAQLPDASAQRAPCVSCLVIGIDAADLESVPPLAPGALEGVQLVVTTDAPDGKAADLVRSASSTRASIAILISSQDEARPSDEVVFDLRTRITELRAAHPDLQILIDADAFAAAGVTLDGLIPYVDAVIGSTWNRLPRASNPTLDDLIRASLTPAGERVLLPVVRLNWSVLQAFSARRPMLVEVAG